MNGVQRSKAFWKQPCSVFGWASGLSPALFMSLQGCQWLAKHVEWGLDRCLEKVHLFGHLLTQWSIYWTLWKVSERMEMWGLHLRDIKSFSDSFENIKFSLSIGNVLVKSSSFLPKYESICRIHNEIATCGSWKTCKSKQIFPISWLTLFESCVFEKHDLAQDKINLL